MKMTEEGKLQAPKKRPKHTQESESLTESERWRNEVLKDIADKVVLIQYADAMDEADIRKLNDDINKLIREKWFWEKRIIEQNGPDFTRYATEAYEDLGQGTVKKGFGRYKYFGAARRLPGVKEMLEMDTKKQDRKNRAELYRMITPDYYGTRDEDSTTLLAAEREAEERAREESLEAFEARQDAKKKTLSDAKELGLLPTDVKDAFESDEDNEVDLLPVKVFKTVDGGEDELPIVDDEFFSVSDRGRKYGTLEDSKEDLELKKAKEARQSLMEKYASKDMQEQESEAKAILNVE
eukprot:TRINITY_DN7647_c0_g1_i2.p1 TRINITY_DN7647_c0_g1~~TRINITY_DN7647_c0_g1_i2.p1  ORF type:complete len:310 (+),score=89.59 TRINITY_DN7647_c0_g1_i2:48-932(+)